MLLIARISNSGFTGIADEVLRGREGRKVREGGNKREKEKVNGR